MQLRHTRTLVLCFVHIWSLSSVHLITLKVENCPSLPTTSQGQKTPFINAVAPSISLWQVCHTRFFHKLSLYLYHLPLGCTLSSFFTSSPSLSSVLTSSGAWRSMQVRTSIICIHLSYHVFSSKAMRSSKHMQPVLFSWCPLQICKLNMLHHKSELKKNINWSRNGRRKQVCHMFHHVWHQVTQNKYDQGWPCQSFGSHWEWPRLSWCFQVPHDRRQRLPQHNVPSCSRHFGLFLQRWKAHTWKKTIKWLL